jgi:hypothetical protein
VSIRAYLQGVPLIFSQSVKVVIMTRKKSDADIEKVIYSFAEAQKFLGISHQTLYKLMKQGLPSHLIGAKRVFLKEDLITWVKEH